MGSRLLLRRSLKSSFRPSGVGLPVSLSHRALLARATISSTNANCNRDLAEISAMERSPCSEASKTSIVSIQRFSPAGMSCSRASLIFKRESALWPSKASWSTLRNASADRDVLRPSNNGIQPSRRLCNIGGTLFGQPCANAMRDPLFPYPRCIGCFFGYLPHSRSIAILSTPANVFFIVGQPQMVRTSGFSLCFLITCIPGEVPA